MSDRKENLDKACEIMGIFIGGVPCYFTMHAVEWLAERQAIKIKKVAEANWRVTGFGWGTSFETLADSLAMAVIELSKRESLVHRNKHLITFQGRTLSIAAWARELDLSVGAIRGRMERACSLEEVLSPNRRKHPGTKKGRRNKIKKGKFVDDTFMEPI